VCEAVAVLTTVPSPKLMVVLVIEPPVLGSVEPAVDALTASGAVPEVGVTVSFAVGGWSDAATVTVAVAVELRLLLSVAVAVTVYVPEEL
jgi:hypothetical protein